MNAKRLTAIVLLYFIIIAGVYYFYEHFTMATFKLKGYDFIATPHFIILFRPESKDSIPTVANAAEKAYETVGKYFDFYPKGKTPIVVFPDSISLQAAFNWPRALTLGNHPRWFTEGVAQYVERLVTGYTLAEDFEPAGDKVCSYEEIMCDFDNLQDVASAYLGALEMTDLLAKEDGMLALKNIMLLLKKGNSANKIFLQKAAALSPEGKNRFVPNTT